MKLDEIKKAVDEGKPVKWGNKQYDVIKDNIGQYMIVCRTNYHTIGLTWKDGVTLNGRQLVDDAKEEITKLEEELRLGYELPVMDMIG